MRRVLAILLACGLASPALAADNAVVITAGSGVTMRSIDVGTGIQAMGQILVSTAGAAIYGTAGTANANVLTIQGVASMTPILATLSGTNTVTTVTTVTTLSTLTGGGVASAAADSGNPIKIGGKYNSTPVTLTDGNRGDLQLDINGYVKVNVTNANANGAASDANSSPVALSTTIASTLGAAGPTRALWLAANASGATGGFLKGLITCDSHVFKHITSATDTLAVQGVASQIIYVCGWRSRAAGTATWFLENTASTNANCSSSNTQITGVASEVANSGEVAVSPFWTGLKNTVANGLCINSTGTGGVDVDIWYTQF